MNLLVLRRILRPFNTLLTWALGAAGILQVLRLKLALCGRQPHDLPHLPAAEAAQPTQLHVQDFRPSAERLLAPESFSCCNE